MTAGVSIKREFEKKFNLELFLFSKENLNETTFVLKSPEGDIREYVTDSKTVHKKDVIWGKKSWTELKTEEATYILFWDKKRRCLFTSTEDYDALAKVVEEAFK